MQLGEIAMEAATKAAANSQLADYWYRRSAEGDPPQPDAFFQLARMHHEVCVCVCAMMCHGVGRAVYHSEVVESRLHREALAPTPSLIVESQMFSGLMT